MLQKKFIGLVYGNLSVEGIREVFEAHPNIVEWAFVLHDRMPYKDSCMKRHYHIFIRLNVPERSYFVEKWFENAVARIEPFRSDDNGDIFRYMATDEQYSSTGLVANFNLKKYLA